MSTVKYKLIKETVEYIQCDVCGGVGHTVKTFQREKYNSPCYMCGSTGRRQKINKTEIELADALRALGILQAPVQCDGKDAQLCVSTEKKS